MAIYKNMLLAVDLLLTHDEYTIERAVKIAKDSGAILYVIHVMEPIHAYGTIQAQKVLEIEKEMAHEARKSLLDLFSSYDLLPDQFILENGTAKHVIVEQAKKLNVDLIIVGSHSRTGLSSLLGSTANGVISNAHCDVLAIRTVE